MLQRILLGSLICLSSVLLRAEDALWVTYEGGEGPGKGKHIVLVAGDEEYRSEEGLPMLGKVLAVHHGFRSTVLFSIDPESGVIDPNNQTNIPGIEALASADMMVIATRFRELPDDDMKHVDDFVNSGKPILGLRTATHAFAYRRDKESPYAKYSFDSREWRGGFGQQVLGDTWIDHHGDHGSESTRGLINGLHRRHPVLRGVSDIWGPTDVYGIRNLGKDADVLVWGQVLAGMEPDAPPNFEKPLMPLVWTKEFTGSEGKTSKVICTTMGSSTDLESEGLRRLLVNACYWALDLEAPEKADVRYVGEYRPTPFGFNRFTEGIKPAQHEL